MGVHFRIHKKLNYFDLDVEVSMADELLVIEGPSGAGKTTILNCIAGIVTPDSGNITVGERTLFDDRQGIDVAAEKRSIGYLFQSYALFPHMTVRRNVLYGIGNKDRHRRGELLEYADTIMDSLGISHLADKHPSDISGGEKQRVALARAMVTKPSLMLLDEPFSALDENTKSIVYEEFARFKKTLKIPTILITHDHREAQLFADKSIILKEGKVIEP